jgi:hypothetical protein
MTKFGGIETRMEGDSENREKREEAEALPMA